ncbi:helicase HerA-like domain-containing protein, partial [Pseudomonas aeruginosa]|uniref:helicase HerA-like domain-containing protein n=1 Tax=Pseudomonas aeruginosa TaxID=287 RepID=UPI003CC67A72
VLTELGMGEALVATLEEKGTPAMVQRVGVAPPYSRIGPLSDSVRAELDQRSPLKGRYDQPFDRESAYEVLASKADAKP